VAAPTWTVRRVTGLLLVLYALNLAWCGVYAPWERLERHATIARDLYAMPTSGPIAVHDYYLEAPLHFLLAHAVGATTRETYLAWCATLVLFGYATFGVLGWRRWGGRGLLVMGVALIAHPVTYVLHVWLGLTDGITFALTAVMLLTAAWPVALVATALGMLNHPMFALVFASLVALRWPHREVRWPFVAAGAAGLATGGAVAAALLARSGREVTGRLDWIADQVAGGTLQVAVDWLPLLLYAFFFALIIPLAVVLPGLWRHDRRLVATYLALLLGFAALAVMTVDKTRVFALLSWAPTIHVLHAAARLHEDRLARLLDVGRPDRRLVLVPLLALAMPHFLVTGEGSVWAPGFFFVWRHVGRLVGQWLGIG
jgi:hypothetical protein